MNLVYLDNNATTKVAPEVIEEMLPYFTKQWGNPSSMYTFGGSVAHKIEDAREKVARLINADPKEIIFTGSGTESDNTAINSAIKQFPNKNHIITSTVEHPAVLEYLKHLEKNGYEITYLPVDNDGLINLSELEQSISDETLLVSIMWANNETGVISPVKEISAICKKNDVLFHTDAVQAAGKCKIDIKDIEADYLTISGHKINAPKGVGVLYVKKGIKFFPLIIGGHQEKGRRAGTENVASIIGLGKASELVINSSESEHSNIERLRNRLENEIVKRIPNIIFNGHREKRLANTSSISFLGIEGEAILLLMNEENICASTGSACSSGSLEPSHVLLAMGIPKQNAHGTIRFSLGKYNTDKDIDILIEKLPAIIKKLRDMSPISINQSC